MTLEDEIKACHEHGVGEAARMLTRAILQMEFRLRSLNCPVETRREHLTVVRDEASKLLRALDE